MTESIKTGPANEEITWEITAFEPNRLCRFEGDTSLGHSQVSYLFEAAGDGTQLTAEVYLQLTGFYRYLRPIIRVMHQKNRENYLAKTKRILENGLDSVDNIAS